MKEHTQVLLLAMFKKYLDGVLFYPRISGNFIKNKHDKSSHCR
jgi:hypothetical protein